MADFEKVVRKHTNDEGGIPADSVPGLIQAIQKAVGEGFVSVDRYNAKKALADELQTKLDEAGDQAEKYKKLQTEFETYKNEQVAKETLTQKQNAYKAVLKKIGVPEKRFAVILKTVDWDELKMTDGKLTNEDAITKQARDDWADFIVATKEVGVPSANPPTNNGGKNTMTKAEIMAIRDTQERQKAIAENHELFGF